MVNAVAEGAPVLYATLESEPAFLALGPTHIAAGSWGPFFLLFIRFSFVLLSKRNVFFWGGLTLIRVEVMPVRTKRLLAWLHGCAFPA